MAGCPDAHEDGSPRPGRAAFAVWAGMMATTAILYIVTANRGPQWQDSGWQQLRIVTGRLGSPLGLALAHPLQFHLGRLAILLGKGLEPAFAITLVSSLAAAVAVANVAAAVRIVTGRTTEACLAGWALAVSHTFWQHATHTESYAITAALLSAEWVCLARYATGGSGRWLLAVAAFNGAGIANHNLALLAALVDVAVLALAVREGRLGVRGAIGAIGLWVAGTLPYSVLVAGEAIRSGDVGAALHSALFGRYASGVLNLRVTGRMAALGLGYVAYNLPNLTGPLAAWGLAGRTSVPRLVKRVLAAELAIYGVFAGRYAIVDQYTFFFPVYQILAAWAGFGMAEMSARWSRVRRQAALGLVAGSIAVTPAVYPAAARTARSRGAFASMVANKPYRDGYRAFFVPWGVGEDHPRRLNAKAFELAGTDGLILVADSMIEPAIRYEQAVARAPASVAIIPTAVQPDGQVAEHIRAAATRYVAEGRAVVLVPVNRDRPVAAIPGTQWRREGDLYVLVPGRVQSGPAGS